MTRKSTVPRGLLFGGLVAIAMALAVAGCAGTPRSAPPPDESQLTAAGFKVLVAETAQQKARLQRLPPDRITAVQRTGAHYFLYPDAAKGRVYIGTPKEYETYLRLQPGNAPNVVDQMNARQAANMAANAKQDAAMTSASQRDLSDPFFGWSWNDFDSLYW